MDSKKAAQIIMQGLKKAGVNFVATLPDLKIVELIRAVDKDPDIKHVPLCREEEGVGICAGAYLTGKKTALLMQNGGLVHTWHRPVAALLPFSIPILLL